MNWTYHILSQYRFSDCEQLESNSGKGVCAMLNSSLISVRKIGWCKLLWQCRESFASFARPYLTLHHEQPKQSYRWLECFLGYSCQQNQCHLEDSRDWTQNFVVSYLCYVRNICRFSVFFHFWRREWRWRQSISLSAIYLQIHSVFEENLLIIMECVWLAAKDVLELKCEQWYCFWRVLFTMPPSRIQHVISRAADRCCNGQSVVCKYKAIDNLWEVVVLAWDWRWLQVEETKNKGVEG